MKFRPYGAAGTVTGSCHLIEHRGYRLLLDCGLYQGSPEEKNEEPFGFDAAAINAVILSHAHLDHIGRLPLLFRRGYRGKVYATPATRKIAPFILEDALKVMSHELERARRKGRKAAPLLWEQADLDAALAAGRALPCYERREFGPFTVELKNAGHLPGSAFVIVEAGGKRLVFSGDIGNRRKEVLPPPDYPPTADLVVSESTYGDRAHRSYQATLAEFQELVQGTLEGGGRLMIPSFALERAQEFLFAIRAFEDDGAIPVRPVFLDSPLASRITNVFDDVMDALGREVRTLYKRNVDPFRTRKLKHTIQTDDSKAINRVDGACTIIAGSGMMNAGRILHHLRHGLPNERNCLLIASYQPRGGLGRLLVEGREQIRLHRKDVRVRARIATLGGFSGHAGRDELLDWLGAQRRIALVHGEPTVLEGFADTLRESGRDAFVARHGEAVEV